MRIGSCRTRVVSLGASHVACGLFTSPNRDQIQLDHFVVKTFVADPNVEGQWLEAIGTALREIATDPRYRGDVRIALPGHLALTKFVRTPAVVPSKRAPVVRFEASQHLPYPMDELIWDFAVVEQTAGHLEVLVTAAKSDALQAVCGAFESAGMRATAISSANLALYHSFQFNYADVAERVLLVDIGARTTHLLFVDQTHYFSRTLSFGGNAITQNIAEATGVTFAEAEKLKIKLQSTADNRLTPSEFSRAVQQAVDQFGMRLHGEMIRSIANMRGALIGQPAKIYVAGGGSHMDSLVAALAKRNDRPAYLFSPLRQVALMPAVVEGGSLRTWPQLSQLVGLAIATNSERSPSADLLPPIAREEMEFRRRRPMLIATALLVAIAFLPAVFYYRSRAQTAENQSTEIALSLKPMRDRQVRNRELLQQIERLRTRIDALNGVAETRTNWQRFLNDIQDRLAHVDDVWLDSLAVQRDDAVSAVLPGKDQDRRLRILLSGRLLDRAHPISKVSAETYDRVKQLITRFSSSDFVASVERERFDNHQPGILRFDLTLVVQSQKNL